MGCTEFKNFGDLNYHEKDFFKEALGSQYKKAKGLKAENKPNIFKKIGKTSIFKEEIIENADESGPVQPWLINVITPTVPLISKKEEPEVEMKIEHCFGIRCSDVRHILYFINDEEIIYISGANVIICNILTKKQTIFGGLEFGESSECHNDDILCIDIFKGDISMIATGQRELRPTVHIWSPLDVSVCYCSFQLPNSAKEVACLSFDKKGEFILAIARDEMNSFYIFDIKNKNFEWTSPTSKNCIFGAEWDESGNQFCLVGFQTIIFGYKGIKKIKEFAYSKMYDKEYYTSVIYTYQRRWIIGDSNSKLLLLNSTSQGVDYKLTVGIGSIQALTGGLHLKYIYCSDSNKNLFVVEELRNSLKIIKKFSFNSVVKSIDINTTGNIILNTSHGEIIYKEIMTKSDLLLNKTDETILLKGHYDGNITGIAIVNSSYFLTSGQDNRVILWNIDNKVCEDIGIINIVEVGEKKQINKFEIPPDFPSNQQSTSISYSKVHDHVAIGIKNGTLSIRKSYLQLNKRFIERDIDFPNVSFPNIMEYSSDGLYLSCCLNENSILIYSVPNYREYKRINELISPGIQMDWDSTNKYLQVVCMNNDFYFINTKSESQFIISNHEEIRDLVWESITCKFGYYVQGIFLGSTDPNYINCVSSTKDKKYLISGDDDKLLNIYNFPVISESTKCKSYFGHCEPISHVKAVDNGRVISIAEGDSSIIIWNLKSK